MSAIVVTVSLAVSLIAYRWIVRPALLSSLVRVPSAHWSSAISRIWITYHRCLQQDTLVVHLAHERLGPVVRLAPDEVSVNSLEGLRAVSTGGFEKNVWYANVFSNYDVQPMFAMPSNALHGQRRKALGNVYAKSVLLSSSTLQTITHDVVQMRLLPHLRESAQTQEPLDLYHVFFGLMIDHVASYCFGISAADDLVTDSEKAKKFSHAYKTR
ncbi:hypothetical protein LTR95_019475, partial [Oleoguttula sp. CCFEE 5521]